MTEHTPAIHLSCDELRELQNIHIGTGGRVVVFDGSFVGQPVKVNNTDSSLVEISEKL